jgi:hypothetical protein
MLKPVAKRSKVRNCERSFSEISGSNLAGDVNVSFVSAVCCQIQASVTGRSLVQRSPTGRGVSLYMILKPQE